MSRFDPNTSYNTSMYRKLRYNDIIGHIPTKFMASAVYRPIFDHVSMMTSPGK
jgi:predicted lipase